MSDARARELLGRYLRQRGEFGEVELVLDQLAPADLLAAMRPLALDGPTPSRREEASPFPHGAPDAPAARPLQPGLAAAPVHAAPEPLVSPGPLVVGPAVPASELVQIGTLDALREVAEGCPRCRLAATRTRVVFGEGDPRARVMVVGEAPGADEDRTGQPFVGRAGKLLDLLLQSIGLGREQVYICNVLKCRPPANRNPQPDEVVTCSPYLLRQVELVGPQAIVAFGTFAAQTLLGTKTPIGKLRGEAHEYHGVPLVPTYHPAAVLRNPGWTRPVWEDLQRLRSLLT